MPICGGEGRSVLSGGWGHTCGCADESTVRKVHGGARGTGSGRSIRACCTKVGINPAQSSAAPKQAKRSAPDHVRWTEVATRNGRSLATFASKQASFSTQRSREEGTEDTEKGGMALRAKSDRTLREAPKSFLSVSSVPFSLLLCVENLACLPWIGPPAVPTPPCGCLPPGTCPGGRRDHERARILGWPP